MNCNTLLVGAEILSGFGVPVGDLLLADGFEDKPVLASETVRGIIR